MNMPLVLRLYRSSTRLMSPAARLLLALRQRRGKEDAERLGERRGLASQERPGGKLVWMHGASVGETVSLLPLVERMIGRGFTVLLTSGTVTSSRVMGQRLPDGAIHQFMPLDVPAYVSRFLDHWRPDLSLITESEIWPNMLLSAHQRHIPLVLVNARLSERSFKRWQRLPGFISALLQLFDICLAQSDVDAERLRMLGAPRVAATGNMKFDVPPPPADAAALAALRQRLAGRRIWLAASTHDGEELAAIAAHKQARQAVPDLLTIIVPRHPDRGEAIAAMAIRAGFKVTRRGLGEMPRAEDDVYVADTLNELGLFYALAPLAFIGGTLVRVGGHNPIEAAKLGTAILHGPYVRNAVEIYAAFDASGAAREVADADALSAAASALLLEPERIAEMAQAGRQTAAALGGAIERTMQTLDPYLLHISLTRDGQAASWSGAG